MKWYAAHIVLYVRYKQLSQTRFPVWENIVLIKAANEEEAFRRAEERGRQDAGDDDNTFRWGGKPAEWVFAGVRKLVLCEDPEKRPGDGTEVTYTEMVLPSKKAVRRFAAGEHVTVRIDDDFPDEDEPAAVSEPRRQMAQ